MRLLAGGPVLHRAWILPAFFDHLDAAESGPDGYVFAGDPHTDADTWAVIRARAANLAEVHLAEPRRDDHRDWHVPGRFARMAELRNAVLGRVRQLQPDWFLSVDSDVLVPPELIANLIDTAQTQGFAAVGGRCYMARRRRCANYGMADPGGRLVRGGDSHGVHAAGVVMAVVLMSPAAYRIDYTDHDQGEDCGWARAARGAGLALGYDGRACAKHVMVPADLDRFDERAGF